MKVISRAVLLSAVGLIRLGRFPVRYSGRAMLAGAVKRGELPKPVIEHPTLMAWRYEQAVPIVCKLTGCNQEDAKVAIDAAFERSKNKV